MGNLDIYEKVRKVPEEAKKTIKGGRTNGFTDINPMWRIKTLTEQFGACGIGWYYEVKREWTEAVGDEICAFVDIYLYVKVNGEWSKPISGTGGSKLATKEKTGIYVSDECYKMATTDAISVACKQLGIGADVYWEKDKTKYDTSNQSQREATKVTYVTQPMIISLKKEIERTGWNLDGLLSWLKVTRIEDITIEKYKYAMSKLEKKPDKIPEPYLGTPSIAESDYEELPFK